MPRPTRSHARYGKRRYPRPKRKRNVAKRKGAGKNAAWTALDDCLHCGAEGPHNMDEWKENVGRGAYKVVCRSCGKYLKFISTEQKAAAIHRMLDRSFPVPKRAVSVPVVVETYPIEAYEWL